MLKAVEKITTGPWKTHCYLVINDSNDCIVVDPGADADLIISKVRSLGATPLAVINTHGHFDHIGAVCAIKEEFNVPFYIHSDEKNLLKNANLYQKLFGGVGPIKIPTVDYYIDQIEWPLKIGSFSCSYLPTPGHTKGSICLLIEDSLFTGDTLFCGEIGRVDLPGASKSCLHKSLVELGRLDPQLKIFPGHGQQSTLSAEHSGNTKFQEALKCA